MAATMPIKFAARYIETRVSRQSVLIHPGEALGCLILTFPIRKEDGCHRREHILLILPSHPLAALPRSPRKAGTRKAGMEGA